MDDKKLTEMLQKLDIPDPDKAQENMAFSAAMQKFEKNQEKPQGKAAEGRPTPITANHWLNQLGSHFMKKSALIGGTALALVLAVGVSFQGDNIKGPQPESVVKLEQEKKVALQQQLAGNEVAKQDGDMAQHLLAAPAEKDSAVTAEVPPASLQVPAMPPMAEMAPQPLAALPELPAAPLVQQFAAKEELRGGRDALAKAKPMAPIGGAIAGNAGVAMEMDPASRHLIIAPQPMPQPDFYLQQQVEGRDKFEDIKDSPLKLVAQEPVSTFSIDVDTSSYSFVRRALNSGVLPDADAVRVEELINYFDYDYKLPESKAEPFEPTIAVYPTPWNKDTKLLHIGIKGYDVPAAEKPRANLVFLIDTSGSMNAQDKLPLLVTAFKMMTENLAAEDTVAIVTYAGNAGTVLEPTKVSDKTKILAALDNLYAGGGTAGAAGIQQAYALAESKFDKGGINRVILATDGDFNVGISDPEELKKYIEQKRKTGVFLSVLGFGQGNYNDELMQKLAQNGNGNAAYIDNVNEARKVLVDEAGSTLFTIAKDVKLQVEFNPAKVAEYRLIGYQTRALNREDFNNDKVDAGDIGSGHTVTAIYEITPVGAASRKVDDLRYGAAEKKEAVKPVDTSFADELAFLKIRYKLPDSDTSKLITRSITEKDSADSITRESTDIQFAASVTAFGQLLRGETQMGDFTFDDVVKLAEPARGEDTFGHRSEFLNMVRTAKALKPGVVIQNPEPRYINLQ